MLEGYRSWTLARASREPLTRTCSLPDDSATTPGPALEALKGFALALGLGTTRSLKMCCAEAPALCRDEALHLGLIAAILMNREPTSCRPALSPPAVRAVVGGGGRCSLLLRGLGRTLLPHPARSKTRLSHFRKDTVH